MASSFKKGYVYLIKNLVNGKCYVGQTVKSVKKRTKEHFRAARNGSGYAIHKAIRKYGEGAFSINLLVTCDASILDTLERYFIKSYGTSIFSGSGYNMTLGGGATSGWSPSEETRRKISDANKGKPQRPEHTENIKKAKAALPPYSHSEESRAKISASGLGKKRPRLNKAPPKEKRPKVGFTMSYSAKEKISKARKGKPLSKSHCEKLSESHKGKKQSPETIAKRVAANTGKLRSDETKAKIRAAALLRRPRVNI
jgi:group I intron endonuclease